VRLVSIFLPLFVLVNYFSKCKLFSEPQLIFPARKLLGNNLSRVGIRKLTTFTNLVVFVVFSSYEI
jgi:hypothetical protein